MDMNKIALGIMALLLLVSAFAAAYLLDANSALGQKIAALNATAGATSQQLAGVQSDIRSFAKSTLHPKASWQMPSHRFCSPTASSRFCRRSSFKPRAR